MRDVELPNSRLPPTGTWSRRRMAMENYSPAPHAPEKFTAADLSSLREELLQSGLDSWQAAELISSFLNVRGYGVSQPRRPRSSRSHRIRLAHLDARRAGKTRLRHVARRSRLHLLPLDHAA